MLTVIAQTDTYVVLNLTFVILYVDIVSFLMHISINSFLLSQLKKRGERMADYDVVVVGGGVGGLTAAALCQYAGMKTLVLEQSDRIGGCCSTFKTKKGFSFDLGASVVEVPHAFEEIFKRIGKKRSDYIDFMAVDPIYDYCDLSRGIRFNTPVSLEGTAEILGQFSKEDAKAFLDFAKIYTPQIKELVENFFYSPCQSFSDAISMLIKFPGILKALPLFATTHQKIVAKWFKHPDILCSMAFQAFYAGLPPDLCAGLYAVVGLLEHQGIYYPKGGMIAIPKGIQKAFEDMGGKVKMKQRVVRIMVENGHAHGVELWDGTQITAKNVVTNINAIRVYKDLIGRKHIPWYVWRGLNTMELSMPCPMIYLGVDYTPPLQAHHTLTLTNPDVMNSYWSDYYLKNEIYNVGGRNEVMGLISWASHMDPSLAPKGHHVLTHMGLAPYNVAGNNWDRYKEQYIDDAIDTIERYMIPDLREHVVFRDMMTPVDLERELLHPGGAVYGIQTDLSHMAMFRPANRSKCIKNLYLCGASTHPGGGVPTVIAGGIITGDLVVGDNA